MHPPPTAYISSLRNPHPYTHTHTPPHQGKSEADIEKAAELFSEIYQQIDSKQLKPFIRTQYMRSAFQARAAYSLVFNM